MGIESLKCIISRRKHVSAQPVKQKQVCAWAVTWTCSGPEPDFVPESFFSSLHYNHHF